MAKDGQNPRSLKPHPALNAVSTMNTSIFSLSIIAARKFEPQTVAEANAAAVVRVIRWMVVAVAIAAAITIALGWLALQLGLAAYHATEGAPQGYEQYLEPIGPEPAFEFTIEELAEASESLPIEWPAAGEAIAAAPVADISEMSVSELRREAQSRGLSIRDGSRVLRKGELIAAMTV
jgi:hypothetical protein